MGKYIISSFLGIDEGRSENTLEPGYTPDAQNMDTDGGDLAVGRGFKKHISDTVPGTGDIHRMYLWHDLGVDKFVVAAGDKLYTYSGGLWAEIFDYNEDLTGTNWDFLESRIGNTDYLIIANGKTQMVKWSGTGSAEYFGSGEYVFGDDTAVTISSLTPAFPKAESVLYAESGTTGAYTLTMPVGYAYEEGGRIAFVVPSVINNMNSITVNDGTNTYALDYVPEWTGGDVAVIKTVSASTAEVVTDEWGYTDCTLSSAIPDEWSEWAKGVGLRINDITYEISELSADGMTATFKEQTPNVKIGDPVKVRGGISDMSVGYIELYYNRLFSAGDPEHPSRLYWSQPPGDVKTIENWSMDDYSESASGGHTEVGPTNNDPIVGLTALSNQLIIHKESGNYRLIGSNPSNFQILQINSGVEKMTNSNRISHGDVPYWMTKQGLYYYNGQQALLHPYSRQIKNTLRSADFAHSKGVECRNRLYFTCRIGDTEDTVLYFDMIYNVWGKRNGFHIADMCTRDGELYLINDDRYVYIVGGTTYDGKPIDAYWRTPITDLGAKTANKKLDGIYMRGMSESPTAEMVVESWSGTVPSEIPIILPASDEEVKSATLWNENKTFHFVFRNKAGSWWKILGGVEILYSSSTMGEPL